MGTFTSSLPDALLALLNRRAKELAIPKNKLIEKALSIYLEQLKKAEYIKSYQRAAKDVDVLLIAEEGMESYLTSLQQTDDRP